MKQKYRIYVLGSIPSDLKERIVAIHAAGILKGKIEDKPVNTQASLDLKRLSLQRNSGRDRR